MCSPSPTRTTIPSRPTMLRRSPRNETARPSAARNLRLGRAMLRDLKPAPGIERVVDLELPLEILEVVWEADPKPGRNGLEAGGQRLVRQAIRVCGVHDPREAQQGLVLEAVRGHDRVERAGAVAMPKLGAGHVEWDRSLCLRNGC